MKCHSKAVSLVASVIFFGFFIACNVRQESSLNADRGPVRVNADEYFKPVGPVFTWTQKHTEESVASLPHACHGGQEDPAKIALMIEPGNCNLMSLNDAKSHITKLGTMNAKYGTNLAEIIKANAQELKIQLAADAKRNLGESVKKQHEAILVKQASKEANKSSQTPDGWIEHPDAYNVGTNQFALNGLANLRYQNKNGMGIESIGKFDAVAFGRVKNVADLYAGMNFLQKDKKAKITAKFRAFGQDVAKFEKTEPEKVFNESLGSINKAEKIGINFSIGPVPFSISLAFNVKGQTPLKATFRAEFIELSFLPHIVSSLSAEGGADVKVAKAGVDILFTLVDAGMKGLANAQLTVQNGSPKACYKSQLEFDLTQILSGNVGAYVEIGWPNKKVFGVRLGWRGDFTFAKWSGQNHIMPLAPGGEYCSVI